MRRLAFTVAVAILALPLAAWAQPAGYVSTQALAEDFGLNRTALVDPGERTATIVVLHGEGHHVTFVAGVAYVSVNGESVALDRAVVAADGDLFAPPEFRSHLAGSLGVEEDEPHDEAAPVQRRNPVVVLDPGHGGKDPGAIGRVLGVKEKDVALDVSRRTARMLREQGVDVRMTRTTDVFVELDDRVRFTNRVMPDLFVSIHADAARPSVRGSTAFIGDDRPGGGNADTTRRALWNHQREDAPLEKIGAEGGISPSVKRAVFGAMMQENRAKSWEAAEHILKGLHRRAGTVSRGTREANFRVVRYPLCPAVLIELEFLTNREAERLMAQPAYRERLARGVADGVMSYLKDRVPNTVEAK